VNFARRRTRPTIAAQLLFCQSTKMTDTNLAVQLHQRRALGETLNTEEQELLEKWYAEQDAVEAGILTPNAYHAPATEALRKQLGEMLQQIASSVQRIQQIASENEQLKQENHQLKQLLPQLLQQQSV
jgi:hypothetical protein